MAEGLDEFPFDGVAADLRQGYCISFLGAGASAFPKNVNAKTAERPRPRARTRQRIAAPPRIKSPSRRLAPPTSTGPVAKGRAQGATLFRPAGQDELKPVTGEQELLDVELDAGEVRLKRTVLFKIRGHVSRTRTTDDTFVITEEDYVSFLGRTGSENSVIPADLVNLIQSRSKRPA